MVDWATTKTKRLKISWVKIKTGQRKWEKEIVNPFHQGHMQSLPNTTSQRRLTFLKFTCSPGSQSKNLLSSYRSQWKGKVRQGRSNEDMKRRSSAPEKVDLSPACSECCHSCIWFSRTQVTSRGVIGPAGTTPRREKVSAFTKTLLHNLLAYSSCCLLAEVEFRYTFFYIVSNRTYNTPESQYRLQNYTFV